mgnify:CR=1 FL=1
MRRVLSVAQLQAQRNFRRETVAREYGLFLTSLPPSLAVLQLPKTAWPRAVVRPVNHHKRLVYVVLQLAPDATEEEIITSRATGLRAACAAAAPVLRHYDAARRLGAVVL